MPTFENLNKNIKKGCDCTTYGVTPITTDIFYRRGSNLPPNISDFLSYLEEEIPLRPKDKDCVARCHHRGVSIYKIVIDLALRKRQIKEAAQVKPIKPPMIYFFRIKDEAGLIWYNENSENLHCELLKADNFSIDEHLEIIDKFDSSGAL